MSKPRLQISFSGGATSGFMTKWVRDNLADDYEIVVTFAPVTLGKGAPFLPRRIETPALRLVGVEKHGDVYAVLTYAVDTVPRVQPTL